MPNRRDFVKGVATATAGMLLGRGGIANAAAGGLQTAAAPRRRKPTIGGRRVKTNHVNSQVGVSDFARYSGRPGSSWGRRYGSWRQQVMSPDCWA